ncbi:hypothetical protein BDB01DRAFT_803016 [Pilobolus umbonatus]|nr:hypothetical protein BDB01DRAFT_803016 [Pilobolus umbonatus]
MRSFLYLSVASLLAVTANAAAIVKRDVTSETLVCAEKLNLIGPSADAIQPLISGFNRTQGFSEAISIYTKHLELNATYYDAGIACCTETTSVFSDEEAPIILDIVKSAVPKIQAYLKSFVTQKAEVDALLLMAKEYKSQFDLISPVADRLSACLVTRSPVAQSVDFTSQKALIDTAYNETITAYNVTVPVANTTESSYVASIVEASSSVINNYYASSSAYYEAVPTTTTATATTTATYGDATTSDYAYTSL